MKNAHFYIPVLALFLFSCRHGNSESVAYQGDYEEVSYEMAAKSDNDVRLKDETIGFTSQVPSEKPSANYAVADNTAYQSKIIKKGNIGIELENYEKNKHQFYDVIRKYDGYISNENEVRDVERISNDLEIRLPNANFDKFMADISEGTGIVNIDYKRSSAIDVGEEYYDLQTRIKTKKEVEKRYIEILRKATKITDILAVEEQIRVIREEIEAKEGRLKFLSDRISYSTVNLFLYEQLEYNAPVSKKATFWGKLGNAAAAGWNFVLGFLIILVQIWPLWIVLIVLIFLIKKRTSLFRRKKHAE